MIPYGLILIAVALVMGWAAPNKKHFLWILAIAPMTIGFMIILWHYFGK